MERLHDACGIVGIYMPKGDTSLDVRRYITLALTALQHRGQESAGMAVYDHDGQIVNRVEMGKVRDVFNDSGIQPARHQLWYRTCTLFNHRFQLRRERRTICRRRTQRSV